MEVGTRRTVKRLAILLQASAVAVSCMGGGVLANGAASIKSAVISENAAWMNGNHAVSGMAVTIDFASRFSPLDGQSLQLQSISSAIDVADANVNGKRVQLNVHKEGVTTISVSGSDANGKQMTDQFEANVLKVGDITGDGTIDQADALFIQQVVKGIVTPTAEERARIDLNGDGSITSADATKAMNLYVSQKKASFVPEYHVTLKDVNDAPVVYGAAVTGTAEVGQTLTGSYQYADVESDAEGASVFKWYRGTNQDGSDKTEIAGASQTQYTLQLADGGHYLFFEVVPAAAAGTSAGIAASSVPTAYVPIPDTTEPALLLVDPVSGATGVDPAGAIALTFSEPVLGTAGKNVTIRNAADDTVVTALDAGDAARVQVLGAAATITGLSLGSKTGYYIEIEAGAFRDPAGNEFAGFSGNSHWSFTTADVLAPQVQLTTPADDATGASYTAPLSIVFDEAVVPVAGKNITFRLASDGSAAAVYDAGNASQVTVAGTTVALANPGLSHGTAYYVEIEPGAFEDAAGNGAGGLTDASDWNFGTLDDVAPLLSGYSPANLAVEVAAGAALTAAFNEPVQPVSGKKITIYEAVNDTVVESYDADDQAKVSLNGLAVSIANPGLATDAAYYVQIDAGAFVDSSANAFAGISGKSVWSFSTVDTIAPSVTALYPADNAGSSAASTEISLTFDEDVTAASGKSITLHRASDGAAIATYDAADDSKVAITGTKAVIANPGLEESLGYYLQVEEGSFRDAAGNAFSGIAGPSAWNFVVQDTAAPTLDSTVPSNQAEGVTVDTIELTFSEAVLSVAGKLITLKKTSDNSTAISYSADDNSHVAIAGNRVTVSTQGLAPGTRYYVQIDDGAFRDASGNVYAGISSANAWTFTTLDNAAPVLASTLPADDAGGVDPTGSLLLTFDENVTGAAGKTITVHLASDGSVVKTYQADQISIVGAAATLDQLSLAHDSSYYVLVEAGAFVDGAGNAFGGIGDAAGWSFTTLSGTATVSAATDPDPLTEASLDGGIVMLTADGGSFADTVTEADFVLNNAPAGATIIAAYFMGEDSVWLQLTHDGTDFDADVTGMTVTARASAFVNGTQDATTNAILIRAEVEAPSIYFSEWLDGSNGRVAIELYYHGDGTSAQVTGYELDIYQYRTSTAQVHKTSLPLRLMYPNMTYNIINSTFYDLFDLTSAFYYNDETVLYGPGLVVNALVLKKGDGTVVDVLGDPNATIAKPILTGGGTLVRRSDVIGGSTAYRANQWIKHPKDTFMYYGRHQQQ